MYNEYTLLELSRLGVERDSRRTSLTKMRDIGVKNLIWFLGYNGSFAVSCEGLSGGLALFWFDAYTPSGEYDHNLFGSLRISIVLVGRVQQKQHEPMQRVFGYEAAWTWADNYEEMVENAWVANSVGPRSLQVNNREHLSKFRPISLCNVLYKIASKVLANWLKPFLPKIVYEFQSAFVAGRLITGSALIVFECLHSVRKQHSKRPFFAPKIDMMKAYDRIERAYLHGCLEKLGFISNRIKAAMRGVTSARYSMRINGDLTKMVIPSRGIRQGDPISPYMFLLCIEGLSCLLQKREEVGDLRGIRNDGLGLPIAHLLLVDDSIFFARSDRRSVEALKATLKSYCSAYGQKNVYMSEIKFYMIPICLCQLKLVGQLQNLSNFFLIEFGKSILFGMDLLKKGVWWGVGNGNSIKILTDNWILGVTARQLETSIPLPPDTKVQFLMNDDFKSWDAHKEVKLRFDIKLRRRNFRNMKQWIFDFLENSSSTQHIMLAVTFWHVLKARNNARNEDNMMHPRRVVQKIFGYVDR
uniref:Reverse transcriptase domain-containing protein n=1 Tax=Oryza brachyantha TaxID=4533 RepID=J3MVP4_ORYBR